MVESNYWDGILATELYERGKFEEEHFRQVALTLVVAFRCRSGSDGVSVQLTRSH